VIDGAASAIVVKLLLLLLPAMLSQGCHKAT
jgi:hypothetical protein